MDIGQQNKQAYTHGSSTVFYKSTFVSLINSFLLTKRKYAMGLFKEKNEINNKTLKENIANIALAQYRVII